MIKGLLVWQNPDSTRDLNSMWTLIEKGIYEGGAITASASNLNLIISPFVAKSKDGMSVVSDATEQRTLTAGTTQYLVLLAKYGTPTATFQLDIISENTWLTSPNKDYYITFAKIVTPALAVQATSATITYSSSDYSDKIGKSPWRLSVATAAALPLTGNRAGDLRLARDTNAVFVWNGTTLAWDAFGMSSELIEMQSRGALELTAERMAISTSGLIGPVLSSEYVNGGVSNTDGFGFDLVESTNPNTLGVGAIHAYVHGHYIQQRAQTLVLPNFPMVGQRYDLAYLEVWQETIPTTIGMTYQKSDGSNGSLATVLAFLNANSESNTTNYTIQSVNIVDDATVIVTKSAIRIQPGVSNFTMQNHANGMVGINNQFGNPYAQMTGADTFAYIASAPSVHSTRTWAIPLMLLLRDNGELLGFNVFRDANRWAFDIAPRSNPLALAELLYTQESKVTEDYYFAQTIKPSGFLTRIENAPIDFSLSGVVTWPAAPFRIRNQNILLNNGSVGLPQAPASGGRRDLVYFEFYCMPGSPDGAAPVIGGAHMTAPMNGAGVRRYHWYMVPKIAQVSTHTDAVDSMLYLGFVKAPNDTGLWQRPQTDRFATRDEVVYAVPVAIVHRRNTGTYAVDTNPNGSVGRPDGVEWADPQLIHPREIVDLRRCIIKRADIKNVIDSTFDKVKSAGLYTRLRQHPFAPDVWGTSAMITTLTTVGAATGKHTMTPVPSTSNAHTCWSDSDELVPISGIITNLGINQTTVDGIFQWAPVTAGGIDGKLTITAPPGMHFAGGSTLIPGPYARSLGVDVTAPRTGVGDRAFAWLLPSNGTVHPAPSNASTITVTAVTNDALGHPVEATIQSTDWLSSQSGTLSTLHVTVWMVKRHRTADTSGAQRFAANGALAGSPTVTYSAKHGANKVNVGAITARVQKTASGSAVFSITQADISAVRSDLTPSGSIRMYGVASMRASSYAPEANVKYIKTLNANGTDGGNALLTVEFNSAPANGTIIEFEVMCDSSDLYQWVNIVPESRQVRGLYSWAYAGGVLQTTTEMRAAFSNWLDRNGGYGSCAPLSESLRVFGGMSSCVSSNRNTVNLGAEVDCVVSIYRPSAAATNIGIVSWFNASDATGSLGVSSPGVFTPNAIRGIRGPDPLGTVVSGHAPNALVGMIGSAQASTYGVWMLSTVLRAPTQPLEITYEIPTYQGMTNSALLKTHLRGEVAYVAPTMVTAEGYNASVLHPAVAELPRLRRLWLGGGNENGPSATAAAYRPPSKIGLDFGGPLSKGTVVDQVRARSKSRVSMFRQIPTPAAPTFTGKAIRYAAPTSLYHSAVSRSQIVRYATKVIPGSSGEYLHDMNTGNFPLINSLKPHAGCSITGSYSSTTLPQMTWAFSLPAGATLLNVRLKGVSLHVDGTDVVFQVKTKPNSGDEGQVIATLNTTLDGFITTWVDFQALGSNKNTCYVQNVGDNGLFMIGLMSRDADLTVSEFDIEYLEPCFDVIGNGKSIYYNWITDTHQSWCYALGVDALKASTDMISPRSSLHDIVSEDVRAWLQNRIIDIPSSWSGSTETEMLSSFFHTGHADFSGDWTRGVTAASLAPAPNGTNIYETDQFAYVPYSGSSLRDHHGALYTIGDITAEIPPGAPKHSSYVSTAATTEWSPYGSISNIQSAVATVTPYGMLNASNELTCGISVGMSPSNQQRPGDDAHTGLAADSQSTSSVFSTHVGGSTIDGFYPVGRPIVEGD